MFSPNHYLPGPTLQTRQNQLLHTPVRRCSPCEHLQFCQPRSDWIVEFEFPCHAFHIFILSTPAAIKQNHRFGWRSRISEPLQAKSYNKKVAAMGNANASAHLGNTNMLKWFKGLRPNFMKLIMDLTKNKGPLELVVSRT